MKFRVASFNGRAQDWIEFQIELPIHQELGGVPHLELVKALLEKHPAFGPTFFMCGYDITKVEIGRVYFDQEALIVLVTLGFSPDTIEIQFNVYEKED